VGKVGDKSGATPPGRETSGGGAQGNNIPDNSHGGVATVARLL